MVWHILISVLLGMLIAGTVLVIILDDGDTGRKVSWLLVIAVLPVVGFILYLLVGLNPKLHLFFEKRRKRFLALRPEVDRALESAAANDGLESIDPAYRPLARMMSTDPFETPFRGNDLEIITTGERKYHQLLEDLAAARETIHMEYFHFGNDRGSEDIRDMLVRKAREGVKVRFLNENIGNFPISPRYYDMMKEAGVEVVKFTNPRRHVVDLITRLNYRNHRKIVVIDGSIGYTGGMNINDKYFLRWRDTHIRVTGPVVASLQYIFLDSWITAGGKVDGPISPLLSPGPGREASEGSFRPVLRDKTVQVVADEPYADNHILQMSYEWAMYNAKRYFYVQTPYFVPPRSVIDALKSAALAGVDVRVMVPREADTPMLRPVNRSFYRECLGAGVRIFERSGRFIHSKTFVSDDYLSCIGTTNLDMRSFRINYEDNAYIYDRQTALQCREIFMEDSGMCHEVTLAEVEAWPWYKHFVQKLFRLFEPLL